MVQKGRQRTQVSSVSISEEFKEIMKKYNISPTEVFRKGMGVTLYEEGVERYNTKMNKKRSEECKKILNQFDKNKELMKKLKKIKQAIIMLEK